MKKPSPKNKRLQTIDRLATAAQFRTPKLPKGVNVSKPQPTMAVKIFKTNDSAKKKLKGKRRATVDGFDNFISRIGLNNDNALSAGFYAFNLMTRNRTQLEAAYRGSWVVGAMIDSVAQDMTRAGVEISTNESKKDIKDLQALISRLQIWQSISSNVKWGRLYGGSIGVLQIEGQKLSTPLNMESIGKGQFKGLAVYDRWQLNPVLDNVINEGPEIGLPKYYDIVTSAANVEPSAKEMDAEASGQIRVHHSRVIRAIGIELPFFQAITEMMWGESVLERLWDRLVSFDNTTMSTASLVDRANLRTVKIDKLREVVAAGGKALDGLTAQFEMMRLAQVNEGLTLLDKEDEFTATPYSFAGLSDVLLQFGQQLAGACGIPLVRLFGQSPAGLSATGESDLRMYYDNINAQQEASLRRPMEILIRILWRSQYGEAAPKDLEFSFTPLWQTSMLDKATIAKTNTETVLGAHQDGLVDNATAMRELRSLSGDTGIFSNITDEAIKTAEEEEPPMPEGNVPNANDPTDPEAQVEAKKPDQPNQEVPALDAAKPSIAKRMRNWVRGVEGNA